MHFQKFCVAHRAPKFLRGATGLYAIMGPLGDRVLARR